MNSIADGSVIIQTSSQCLPSAPPWFGEVALLAESLRKQDILSAIGERIRFARRRFGHYDVIDFVAVLFGYATSGECTLEAFSKRLHPFAPAFMALFGRERLPSRSTLSRFLASLSQPPGEALRTLFLEDLLARPLNKERQTGGLVDRAGRNRVVFDIDGTRQAARQRALPKTADLPAPQRRLTELCAPGGAGRKRGEIVRTRTTISQAHTSQWLGSFANPGNGRYREELRRAVAAIGRYSKAYELPEEQVLLRLDGQYGTAAVIGDLAGFCYVMRGKDYQVLDRAEVQSRLHLPPDQQFSRPESKLVRALYDCPDLPVGPTGERCRVVVATHPAKAQKSRIGLTRSGLVYALFFTHLPQGAFTSADVVALYWHRGAFEPILADEEQEQNPDRWCSQVPAGQECWQIIRQWVWNLRLELGHQLQPDPLRTTACAPAYPLTPEETVDTPSPVQGYAPPDVALPWKQGRFSGHDFAFQPDGTLRCPAGQTLCVHERRKEGDGSLRVVYAASIHSCRPCPLREQCQWNGKATGKPRQVSVLLRPLVIGASPLLWRDWSCREHRRAWMQQLRDQSIEVRLAEDPPSQNHCAPSPSIRSRAQRAHFRLSWVQRLTRNARAPAQGQVTINLFGVPEHFAHFLGRPGA